MNEFRAAGDLEQGTVDIEKQRHVTIKRRWSRFAQRQRSVFVRRTYPNRGVCPNRLIFPGFSNHAKTF